MSTVLKSTRLNINWFWFDAVAILAQSGAAVTLLSGPTLGTAGYLNAAWQELTGFAPFGAVAIVPSLTLAIFMLVFSVAIFLFRKPSALFFFTAPYTAYVLLAAGAIAYTHSTLGLWWGAFAFMLYNFGLALVRHYSRGE